MSLVSKAKITQTTNIQTIETPFQNHFFLRKFDFVHCKLYLSENKSQLTRILESDENPRAIGTVNLPSKYTLCMIHKNEITEITQFFNSLTTKKSFLLINQHTK